MRGRGFAAAAVGAVVCALAPSAALAHKGDPMVTPVAEGLAGPLQFAVGDDGTVYAGQAFAGLLTRINGTDRADIASAPGAELSGVSLAREGDDIYYTVTADASTGAPAASLNVLRNGASSVLADLQAYEVANNPDQDSSYGFEGISDECAAKLPAEAGPATYTGIVESHPYATATSRRRVYVADAAANAVLWVSRHGTVRTLAVLPPQPLVITADLAAGQGLPDCTIGLTYDFEPVPTDVEVGKDGWVYVTTLPGGPEDPSFPPRGAVWKINPHTGAARKIADGLAGATNLAIGKHGVIYVTELFGGRVSRIDDGRAEPLIELPSPASIEYAHGRLYVGYDVFEAGKVGVISH